MPWIGGEGYGPLRKVSAAEARKRARWRWQKMGRRRA